MWEWEQRQDKSKLPIWSDTSSFTILLAGKVVAVSATAAIVETDTASARVRLRVVEEEPAR